MLVGLLTSMAMYTDWTFPVVTVLPLWKLPLTLMKWLSFVLSGAVLCFSLALKV